MNLAMVWMGLLCILPYRIYISVELIPIPVMAIINIRKFVLITCEHNLWFFDYSANALEILQSCTEPSIWKRHLYKKRGKGELQYTLKNLHTVRLCCGLLWPGNYCLTETFQSHSIHLGNYIISQHQCIEYGYMGNMNPLWANDIHNKQRQPNRDH